MKMPNLANLLIPLLTVASSVANRPVRLRRPVGNSRVSRRGGRGEVPPNPSSIIGRRPFSCPSISFSEFNPDATVVTGHWKRFAIPVPSDFTYCLSAGCQRRQRRNMNLREDLRSACYGLSDAIAGICKKRYEPATDKRSKQAGRTQDFSSEARQGTPKDREIPHCVGARYAPLPRMLS